MPTHFFSSYESEKLFISQPELCSFTIWAVLLLFIFFSAKKTENAALLNREQSLQLRGLAILLVATGHLWVHVSQVRVMLVMGSDAVALFLLLSGFGLTRSVMKRPVVLKKYIVSRIRRVMVPYWAATVFILLLDYILLKRCYYFSDILLTISGINLSSVTKNIDYVRWYITFILFWYIIFYPAVDRIKQTVKVRFLLCSAIIVYFGSYYGLHIGWSQIFAFPAGCVIGKHYKYIQKILSEKSDKMLLGTALLIGGGAFIFKYMLLPFIGENVPGIVNKGLREGASLFLGAGLMAAVYAWNKMGYISRFLCFTGLISYELFLLHGAFLIKYNPVFQLRHAISMPGAFLLYLMLMLLLSLGFHKLTEKFGA